MSERITIIKATKRQDLWDFNNNKPLKDDEPIGLVMDTFGAVPESYIKWVPNKIFDKRKYPELYALFGKDHLPNDLELKCYVQKHYHEWHSEKKSVSKLKKACNFIFYTLLLLISLITMYSLVR